jgi:hypothetical protein
MPRERVWDSFANTKRHQYNKTTNYLGQWDPVNPGEMKEEEKKPEKEKFNK